MQAAYRTLYNQGFGLRETAGRPPSDYARRAKVDIKRRLRGGLTKKALAAQYTAELDPLVAQLRDAFEGKHFDLPDVQALWGRQFPRKYARWFLCTSVLLELGAIVDSQMDGWDSDIAVHAVLHVHAGGEGRSSTEDSQAGDSVPQTPPDIDFASHVGRTSRSWRRSARGGRGLAGPMCSARTRHIPGCTTRRKHTCLGCYSRMPPYGWP